MGNRISQEAHVPASLYGPIAMAHDKAAGSAAGEAVTCNTGRPGADVIAFTKSFQPRTIELRDGSGLMVLASDYKRRSAAPCTIGPPAPVQNAAVSDMDIPIGHITSLSAAGQELHVVWELEMPRSFGPHDSTRSPCRCNSRFVSPTFPCSPSQNCTQETAEAAKRQTSMAEGATDSAKVTVASAVSRLALAPTGPELSPNRISNLNNQIDLQHNRGARMPAGQYETANRDDITSGSFGGLTVGTTARSEASSSGVMSPSDNYPAATTPTSMSSVTEHPKQDQWRLMLAMCDHHDSHVSLYLSYQPSLVSAISMMKTPGDDQQGSDKSDGMTLQPVSWQVLIQGLVGDEVKAQYAGVVPAHNYLTETASWGIQGLLALQDIYQLMKTQRLRVCAQLYYGQDVPRAQENNSALRSLPNIYPGHGAPVHAVAVSLSPRILLIDKFLEPELCEGLINLGGPRLVRSRVSTGTETPSRTSRGTFFTGASADHPLIQQVEQRIAALVASPAICGGKKPLMPSEALQVVRYGPGEFYTEHYDNKAGGVVSRHATILIYLNDCEAGGGTLFTRATAPPTDAEVPPGSSTAHVALMSEELHENPRVSRPGVRVLPVEGRAIVFWSALPSGGEDLASLHAAEPVLAGTKWIASRWFKEKS